MMRTYVARAALLAGIGAGLAACGDGSVLGSKKTPAKTDTAEDAATTDTTEETVDRTGAEQSDETLGLAKKPPAKPQKPTGPWTLGLKSLSGPGCPAGSVATNVSPDQEAFTLIFSQFAAEVQPNAKPRTATTRCNLELALTLPSGWQAAVLGLDYRGFDSLDAGVKAQLTTTYQYTSPKLGPTHVITAKLAAPHDGDFQIHHDVQVANMVWTPCTVHATMRVAVAATVDASKKKSLQGFVQVDSEDGELRQKMGIAFRPCK